jgi:hypothetical protein
VAGVFINYRKDDGEFVAESLAGRLRDAFGRRRVFLDHQDLPPGRHFPPLLLQALEDATVLVAVIGGRWLAAAGADGSRRLDDPDDYVRMEIRRALERNIHVLPLLLNDTRLPTAAELPDDIRALSQRQGVRVDRKQFRRDVDALVTMLGEHIPRKQGGRGKKRATYELSDITFEKSAVGIGDGASATYHGKAT